MVDINNFEELKKKREQTAHEIAKEIIDFMKHIGNVNDDGYTYRYSNTFLIYDPVTSIIKVELGSKIMFYYNVKNKVVWIFREGNWYSGFIAQYDKKFKNASEEQKKIYLQRNFLKFAEMLGVK